MGVRVLARTSAALVVVAALVWSAAQAGGPAAVKVGDWVSYKSKSDFGELSMKMTVTAKDDKEATVKVEAKFGEKEFPSKEQKVPLSELTDPTKGMQGFRAAGGPAAFAGRTCSS